MKFRFAAGVGLGIAQVVASFPEPYRVLEQTGEGLAEAFPRGGAVVLVDFDELGEEMKVAALFGQGLEGVDQEVGNRDPREHGTEDLLDDRLPRCLLKSMSSNICFVANAQSQKVTPLKCANRFRRRGGWRFRVSLGRSSGRHLEKPGETPPSERQAPRAHPEAERDDGVLHPSSPRSSRCSSATRRYRPQSAGRGWPPAAPRSPWG